MKISCDVIGDLLPLYAEEMASQDSAVLVADHVRECEVCRRRLDSMRQPVAIPRESVPEEMRNIGKRLLQRTVLLVMAMVFFATTVVTWTFAVLSLRSVPVPLESSVLGVRQENGKVLVEMRVTGYLSWWDQWDYRYDTEVGGKIACFSVNRRLWDVLFQGETPVKTYEVPVMDAYSIWFFTGSEAECIYGDETAAPKPDANPVLWTALSAGAVCLLLFFLTGWKWLRIAVLFAGNLLLADFAMTGFAWSNNWYSGLGFIWMIYLLMALLMTCSQCLAWALWKDRNRI